MFFFQEGFTYRNFLMDVLAIFIFIVWFWLLITVFSDLFRRHDISGWIKAIWVIAIIPSSGGEYAHTTTCASNRNWNQRVEWAWARLCRGWGAAFVAAIICAAKAI